jgi:hypothetical protein
METQQQGRSWRTPIAVLLSAAAVCGVIRLGQMEAAKRDRFVPLTHDWPLVMLDRNSGEIWAGSHKISRIEWNKIGETESARVE